MWSYVVHAVSVRSELELPGLVPVAETDGRPDVAIRVGDRPIPRDPSGRVVAFDESDGRSMQVTATGGSHLVHAEGIDLMIRAGAGGQPTVIDVVHEPAAAGTVGWFVGGAGLAIALMLRGDLVMHASMVEHAETGILLVAPSGRGKSVTAAAAVGAGAHLVAEDTVRLSESASGWAADPGSTALRLRRTVDEVRLLFPDATVTASSDGRAVVDPGVGHHGRRPVALDRIVFIALDSEATQPTLVEVEPTVALMTLLGQIRVPGLVDPGYLDAHFDRLSGLVGSVGAFRARLPWTGDLGELRRSVTGTVLCGVRGASRRRGLTSARDADDDGRQGPG